jgi:hypothetical protein
MPSRCFRRIAITFALLASAGLGATGYAAPPDLQLQAARQQFAQAEEDEDAGRWKDALDKLHGVLGVKRTAGVQYHVALCEEHIGQLVAALADYTAADNEAHSENAQDVLKLVGKRLAELEPRVPRLTIHVVPDVPDTRLTLDGATIAPSLFGVAMPVDPGTHRVEATAQAHVPTSADVTMREHDSTVLDVKLVLADAVAPTVEQERDRSAANGSSSGGLDRGMAIAYSVATVVLAGGGVGAYVAAGSARDRAVSGCAQVVSLAADACDSQKQAIRAWDWAAAGAWAGAAAASTLAVLAWTTPSRSVSRASSVRVVVGVGSLGVGGDF